MNFHDYCAALLILTFVTAYALYTMPVPRRSRYVGGWFCARCGFDNPDEESPCADLETCARCGHDRPLETYIPPRAPQ